MGGAQLAQHGVDGVVERRPRVRVAPLEGGLGVVHARNHPSIASSTSLLVESFRMRIIGATLIGRGISEFPGSMDDEEDDYSWPRGPTPCSCPELRSASA